MSIQIRLPAKRKRLVGSVKKQLLVQAQEAALCAIKVFNDPLVKFKSEAFIVLMVIAWTYLLHAYYRSKRIEYRYFKTGKVRRTFERIEGQYKYWELSQCLKDEACPLDRDTTNNLKFLVGLRNQIEHKRASELDTFLSGRYQACALNYNYYLQNLFGEKYALDEYLTYSIQFAEMSFQQAEAIVESESAIPKKVRSYIAQFDNTLSEEECNSDRYSYRILFTRKLTSKPGQADRVIEFIDPNSDLAPAI